MIWLYAFFDSYALRSPALPPAPPRRTPFSSACPIWTANGWNALLHKRHSLIGWVLVAVGVYMLYDMLMGQLSGLFFGWFGEWLYSLLRYGVPRLVITVLVILLGAVVHPGAQGQGAHRRTSRPLRRPPLTPPRLASAGTDPVEEAAADISRRGGRHRRERRRTAMNSPEQVPGVPPGRKSGGWAPLPSAPCW